MLNTPADTVLPHMQDFAEVLRRPKLVMLGAALQYTVMPGLGFFISRVFQLPPAYAVGCVASSTLSATVCTPASCADISPQLMLCPVVCHCCV